MTYLALCQTIHGVSYGVQSLNSAPNPVFGSIGSALPCPLTGQTQAVSVVFQGQAQRQYEFFLTATDPSGSFSSVVARGDFVADLQGNAVATAPFLAPLPAAVLVNLAVFDVAAQQEVAGDDYVYNAASPPPINCQGLWPCG